MKTMDRYISEKDYFNVDSVNRNYPKTLQQNIIRKDYKSSPFNQRIRHGIETALTLLTRIEDYQRRYDQYPSVGITPQSVRYKADYTAVWLNDDFMPLGSAKAMPARFVPINFKEKINVGDEKQKTHNLKEIHRFQIAAVLYTCTFADYPFKMMDEALVQKNISENKAPQFLLPKTMDKTLKLKIEVLFRQFYIGSNEFWQDQFKEHFPDLHAKTDPLEKLKAALIKLQQSLPPPLASNSTVVVDSSSPIPPPQYQMSPIPTSTSPLPPPFSSPYPVSSNSQGTNQQSSITENVRVPNAFNMTVTQNLELNPQHVKMDQNQSALLGSGSYGVVYMGYHTTREQKVAVKVLNSDAVNGGKIEAILKECKLMASLQPHPNIASFYGVMVGRKDSNNNSIDSMAFVLEYVPNGDLNTLLHKKTQIPLNLYQQWEIFLGASRGLQYLHNKKITHRDIKPANVLVKEEYSPETRCVVYRPKLTDFSTSKNLESTNTTATAQGQALGTPSYMAPELFQRSMMPEDNASSLDHFKVDDYALAILLLEILTRRKPYENVYPIALAMQVMQGVRPQMGDLANSDDAAKSFIERGLAADPQQRPAVTKFYNFAEGKSNFFKTELKSGREVGLGCHPAVTSMDKTQENNNNANTAINYSLLTNGPQGNKNNNNENNNNNNPNEAINYSLV